MLEWCNRDLDEDDMCRFDEILNHRVNPEDITLSDGAKCDIGRLQLLFGENATIAVGLKPDPATFQNTINAVAISGGPFGSG